MTIPPSLSTARSAAALAHSGRHPGPIPEKLAAVSAVILAVTLFFSILTIYFEGSWSIACCAAALFALGAVWSVRMLIRPYPLCIHPALVPLVAIVLLGALQLATGITISRWYTAAALLRWIAYTAAFAIALQLGAIPSVRGRLLLAFLFFGFAFSAVAAAQYLSEPAKIFGFLDPPGPGAWLGPFYNKDHYASFMQLLFPIALYEAFARKCRLILSGVIAAMMFASVIEGASRAGSFLIVVETALILVLAFRRKLPAAQRGMRTFVVPLVLIAVLTIASGWTRLWERANESDPYGQRKLILESCVEMIRERPLTGFGFGNFENAYPRFAILDDNEIVGHAHNDWAEWTVEGGLPLALLMLTVAVLSAPALWRSLWGIGILSVLTHCLIDFPMNRPPIALWTFALMGLACGAARGSPVFGVAAARATRLQTVESG